MDASDAAPPSDVIQDQGYDSGSEMVQTHGLESGDAPHILEVQAAEEARFEGSLFPFGDGGDDGGANQTGILPSTPATIVIVQGQLIRVSSISLHNRAAAATLSPSPPPTTTSKKRLMVPTTKYPVSVNLFDALLIY